MKRILTIVSCAMLFALSSCTKQYVTANDNLTVYADLPATAWSLYTDNNGKQSYSAPINVNQLDNNFTATGGVIVSISYDGGSTYEQLPEVYDNLSYSFTYNAGNLTLYAQSADGTTAVQPGLPVKVKIVLVSSSN